jgi:glycosyltransferase involved in cell wall biosynthesis
VDCEHIIQDAGSDDGTLDIVRNLPGVKLHVEKDQGMYDAVNRGLRKATGEIAAYLNCDEQYLPGTLPEVLRWFQDHPECDVLFGDIVVTAPEGGYLCDRTALVPTEAHTRVSANLSFFTAATFFRREAVMSRNLWFNPAWKVVGDSIWALDLIRSGVRMAAVRKRFSAFAYSGRNLSLDPKASAERARLRLGARPWIRALRPLIVANFRLRRLMAGGYSIAPYSYEVFTPQNVGKRTRFNVPRPTHRWPGG